VADLATLVLQIVKHYPSDGIRLLEFFEELADANDLHLRGHG
jgi:uncharacterized lipoprotein YddW (UPF0748 family)